MRKQSILTVIFVLSIAGLLFSGYLSYSELFKKTCALGSCISVSGIPACVYGFFMYLIIFILALIGLRSRD